MGVLTPCFNFWGNHSVLNTDAMKLLAFPTQETPYHCYPTKQAEKNLLYKLLGTLAKASGKGLALVTLPSVRVLSCLDHLV